MRVFLVATLALAACAAPSPSADAQPDAQPDRAAPSDVVSDDARDASEVVDASADVSLDAPDASSMDASPPECAPGSSRFCYDGPPDTRGRGACQQGSQECIGGRWSSCNGQVLPRAEVCGNAIDEDCDGQTTCAADAASDTPSDARDAAADTGVCPTNSVMCGGGCCPLFAMCDRNTCYCAMGQGVCGRLDGTQYCANLSNQPDNCGECRHQCEAFRPRCVAGTCVP